MLPCRHWQLSGRTNVRQLLKLHPLSRIMVCRRHFKILGNSLRHPLPPLMIGLHLLPIGVQLPPCLMIGLQLLPCLMIGLQATTAPEPASSMPTTVQKQKKPFNHYNDFFAARKKRQEELMKLESPRDRQRRESR